MLICRRIRPNGDRLVTIKPRKIEPTTVSIDKNNSYDKILCEAIKIVRKKSQTINL